MYTLPDAFTSNCLFEPDASASAPSAYPPKDATPTLVKEAYSLENVIVFAVSS